VNLRPLSFYAREVKAALPARAFSAVPSRLLWLALHVTVIATGILALAKGWGGMVAAPILALVIGHSFAGCAFVGHETMHGAVLRSRMPRYLVGWLCFLPFTLSPRLWVAWHNKVHHGHTMEDGVDPDSYPTLAQYKKSLATRVADYLSVGTGRWLGWVTLLIGFTGQSTQMLWRWAPKSDAVGRRDFVLAVIETLAGIAVWTTVGFLVGGFTFLFAFVIPLMVANLIVISYILTNHSLSPMTEVNDPLVNSLSVSTPRVMARLHLNFGLHVEHHLFPSMSSAYAPLVRDELVKRWPERYQSLPLFTALKRLFVTPRVYVTATRLHDPLSGREAVTLLPGSHFVEEDAPVIGDGAVPCGSSS
jgi:fatty acid desaturase